MKTATSGIAFALGLLLAACGGTGSTSDGAAPDGDQTSDAEAESSDAAPDTDATSADGPEGEAGWRSLFDGTTFAGWQTYLGPPAAGDAPLGLDDDPRGVFTIATVDGAPAIHISGEVWGALISRETFCGFHLRAEYKWGTRVWPGLGYRDAGFMYMSTGPLGAVNAGGPALSNPPGTGAFMVSLEFQVTPTDVGALMSLGPISLTPRERTVPTERANDWNEIEIIVSGGVATHRLNGAEVARDEGFSITWPGQTTEPLACGKLQVQSEGAEIYWRRLEIEPL